MNTETNLHMNLRSSIVGKTKTLVKKVNTVGIMYSFTLLAYLTPSPNNQRLGRPTANLRRRKGEYRNKPSEAGHKVDDRIHNLTVGR